MCRFVLYLGQSLTLDLLTTKPVHSLIHQSFKSEERHEPLNGDGFGIAWYVPALSDEPAVFRSTTPAWNNANLRQLARVTRSHCVMAHVRAATPPLPVIELNCHPFTHGRFALMHNGYIPHFGQLRRGLLRNLSEEAFQLVKGSTDSEHILAMFVDRLGAQANVGNASEAMARALEQTIFDLEALLREAGVDHAPRLNVAVTNGDAAVISRYCGSAPDKADSLYLHEGKRYVCEDGVCRMIEPDASRAAVIVASEPLSKDPGWDKVPANHLLVVDSDRTVSTRPLTNPAA